MSQTVRIFISSPGDVKDERLLAKLVIGQLKREFAHFLEITSELWEYEPMLVEGHFQDIIDPPGQFDIVVVILWSRLGTPLPQRTAKRAYQGIDGRSPVTGTEWEFEQALAARSERGGSPDLLVYRNFSPGKAEFTQEEQLDQIKQQWQMLRAFWARHFQDRDGFKLAFNTFISAGEFGQKLEAHLRELLRRRLPPGPLRRTPGEAGERIEWWTGSPYRGLQVFDSEHAAVFFGREKAERAITEALVRRAAEGKAFMLVLGASGSGKSSLVRAGLVPDLTAPGVVSGITTWRRAILAPVELGSEPSLGIVKAFLLPDALPELAQLGYSEDDLAKTLRVDAGLLLPHIRVALEHAAAGDRDAPPGASRQARLLLVIDQFEVLFTSPAFTQEARHAFSAALATLARSGLVWIVATMRSDFFHRLAELPEINELAGDAGQYHLTPPTAAELDLIISRPAAAAGIAFESASDSGVSLAAIIRDAAARDLASLPMVSFLLDELYRRDIGSGGGILTFASYEALGRLEGAIAGCADAFVTSLPEPVAAALPALLLSLVQLDESGGTATARTVRQAAITDEAQREAANRLVESRLAVADRSAGETTTRIAHEALFSHWPTLRRLVEGHRDFLLIRRRLQNDAAVWRTTGKDAELLLPPGRRLAEAEDMLSRRRSDLDAEIVDYAEASIAAEKARLASLKAAAERELRDRLKRSRRFLTVVSLLLTVALGGGYLAWHQRNIATSALQEAAENYQAAVDQSIGSVQLFVDSYEDVEISTRMMQRLVDQAKRTLDKLRGSSDSVVVARAQLFDVLSTANTALGHFDQALSDAATERQWIEPLATRETGRIEWSRILASAHGRLSDAYFRKGDSQEARDHADIAIGLAQQLLRRQPDDDALLRDQTEHHERRGLAARSMGQIEQALAAQAEWLKLAQVLAGRHPTAPAWQRSIANARQERGDTLLASGRPAEAANDYRPSIEIYRQLRQEDPDKVRYLHLLAATQLRLGEAYLRQNDSGRALVESSEANAMAGKLVQTDPSVFPWRVFFEDTHRAIGDALLADKLFVDAEKEYRRYLDLARESRRKAPTNGATLFAESNAHQKIGDALVRLDRRGEAFDEYQESLKIGRDLSQWPISRQAWRKNLATTQQRIGTMLRERGDKVGALVQFRACAEAAFNPQVWAPRNYLPPDVVADCRQQAAELERQ